MIFEYFLSHTGLLFCYSFLLTMDNFLLLLLFANVLTFCGSKEGGGVGEGKTRLIKRCDHTTTQKRKQTKKNHIVRNTGLNIPGFSILASISCC